MIDRITHDELLTWEEKVAAGDDYEPRLVIPRSHLDPTMAEQMHGKGYYLTEAHRREERKVGYRHGQKVRVQDFSLDGLYQIEIGNVVGMVYKGCESYIIVEVVFTGFGSLDNFPEEYAHILWRNRWRTIEFYTRTKKRTPTFPPNKFPDQYRLLD